MTKKRQGNRFRKFLLLFFLFIVVVLIGGYIYFNLTYPKTLPAVEIKFDATEERIARGDYLVNHVTVCLSCHSQRDWSIYSGPIIPGTEGMGGQKFEDGVPGTLYAGNITPSGIGEWTDGEILRTITTGVTRDNRVLFPLMPYPEYHNLSLEDLYSIIAYIRNLKPIVHEVPSSSIDFPTNVTIKMIPPESYVPITSVDELNPNEYGKYLVTIAACRNCHTPTDGGKFIANLDFAGGTSFTVNGRVIESSNITPDIETGIGRWTQEDFLNRFKQYENKIEPVKGGESNTPMPWTSFAGMKEQDLTAIYEYLKSIPPVHHKIQNQKLK
ncbi:MAG TPA: c-type cytochrome [Ignavibacteriaceae bacterium]